MIHRFTDLNEFSWESLIQNRTPPINSSRFKNCNEKKNHSQFNANKSKRASRGKRTQKKLRKIVMSHSMKLYIKKRESQRRKKKWICEEERWRWIVLEQNMEFYMERLWCECDWNDDFSFSVFFLFLKLDWCCWRRRRSRRSINKKKRCKIHMYFPYTLETTPNPNHWSHTVYSSLFPYAIHVCTRNEMNVIYSLKLKLKFTTPTCSQPSPYRIVVVVIISFVFVYFFCIFGSRKKYYVYKKPWEKRENDMNFIHTLNFWSSLKKKNACNNFFWIGIEGTGVVSWVCVGMWEAYKKLFRNFSFNIFITIRYKRHRNLLLKRNKTFFKTATLSFEGMSPEWTHHTTRYLQIYI